MNEILSTGWLSNTLFGGIQRGYGIKDGNGNKVLIWTAKGISVLILFIAVLVTTATTVLGQTIILSEDFQGAFPGSWSVGDSNSSGTSAYWKDRMVPFGSIGQGSDGSTWIGYCAGNGYGGSSSSPIYQDYMDAYMSRTVNLSGYGTANLTFWYAIPSIETSVDRLEVYVDGTRVWYISTANPGFWNKVTIDLSGYVGSSHILKFNFHSDSSIHYEGAYLDNIVVTGTALSAPSLVDASCYISPTDLSPGGRLTVYYRVYNPNSVSVTIGLGCSIRKNGTSTWINDSANDVYRICPAGYSTQSRYFDNTSGTHGSYDVAWGLWMTFGGTSWYSLSKLSQFNANRAPQLSGVRVTPTSGGTIDTFAFYATYTDLDGDWPSSINVELDGSGGSYEHVMTYVSGTPASGAVYCYQGTPAVGSHSFYVYATDGYGGVVGSSIVNGPTVVVPTVTIYNASWSNTVDCDGDGYPRSAQLNWDPDVVGSTGSLDIFEKIYWRVTGNGSWNLITTTLPHTITGNSGSDAVGVTCNEWPHNRYDWKIEVYRSGQFFPDYVRDSSNDSDLSGYALETVAEDPVVRSTRIADGDLFVSQTAKVGIPVKLQARLQFYDGSSWVNLSGQTVHFDIYYSDSWHEVPDDGVSGTSFVTDGNGAATQYYSVPKSLGTGNYQIRARYDGASSTYDLCSLVATLTVQKPTWLILYYVCNGNDLSMDAGVQVKFNTIAAQLPNDNVEAFMLCDRMDAGTDHVFRMKNDTNPDNYTDGVDRWTPQQIGMAGMEFNTGDVGTLNAFANFVLGRCSADHVSLVIFNHGGGVYPTVLSSNQSFTVTSGIGWDDTGAYLSISELGQAVRNVQTQLGKRLDILHLDACLMSMIEIDYEVRNSVDYVVSSENEGWYFFAGTSWESYLSGVGATTTPLALAQSMANSFFDCGDLQNRGRTIAVTQMSSVAAVASAIDSLAASLLNNLYATRGQVTAARTQAQKMAYFETSTTMTQGNIFLDLRDFCEELASRVSVSSVQVAANAVVSAIGNSGGNCMRLERHANGPGATQNSGYWFDRGTYGMSVFFPESKDSTYFNYINDSGTPANLAFTASTRWDEFLTLMLDATAPGAPTVSSPTHPDQNAWYLSNSVTLSWTTPTDESGIKGYSYTLDGSATTTPDTILDGTGTSMSYSGLSGGTWYFHVRAVDLAGNWGPTSHFHVNISIAEPSPSLSVFPGSVGFGAIAVGTTNDLSVTIQNVGGGVLSGGASGVLAPFSIMSGGTYSLVAGATQTVTLRYCPTVAGSHTQNLVFSGGGGASAQVTGIAYSTVADADGDGMPDWAEVVAGSCPTDSASCFKVTLPLTGVHLPDCDGFIIQWESHSNRFYFVDVSTNLSFGFHEVVGSNLPATPPLNTFTDTVFRVGVPKFYRIRVEWRQP